MTGDFAFLAGNQHRSVEARYDEFGTANAEYGGRGSYLSRGADAGEELYFQAYRAGKQLDFVRRGSRNLVLPDDGIRSRNYLEGSREAGVLAERNGNRRISRRFDMIQILDRGADVDAGKQRPVSGHFDASIHIFDSSEHLAETG